MKTKQQYNPQLTICSEQIEDYFKKDEYITWERLAKIKPPQMSLDGYWRWNNVNRNWEWVMEGFN